MEELCEFFDVELTDYEKYELTYTFQLVSLFGGLIPQVKYSLNLVFNWFWDEVPPVRYEHLFGWKLLPRALRLRIKQMKKYRHRVKNQIRMYTLFQGFKKGLMPIDPDQVDDSLIKHSRALTNEANSLPEDIAERCEELLGEMIHEEDPFGPKYRHRYQRRIWQARYKFSWDYPISRKATYDFAFGDGGNVAYLLDQMGYDYRIPWTSQLAGYVQKSDSWEPIEVRALGPTRRELLECDAGFRALEFISSPACILEPMKARIITKPYQGLHLGLNQLQKKLWNYLYQHHSGFFKLIGEPLQRAHLWPILAEWDVGKKFCSGDFSAATDNLKQQISEMVYRKFFEYLVTVEEDYLECKEPQDPDNNNEWDKLNPRLYYRGLNSLTASKLDYSRAVLPTYPFNYNW
jgi:hypothetical protein